MSWPWVKAPQVLKTLANTNLKTDPSRRVLLSPKKLPEARVLTHSHVKKAGEMNKTRQGGKPTGYL